MKIAIPAVERERAVARLQLVLMAHAPGKPLVVDIEEQKEARNSAQNNALFGVAYKALREQTGNDTADLHEMFCGRYFGWHEYEVIGVARRRPLRTTTIDADGKRSVLPIDEFARFYEFVQDVAAQNGFYVPDPDPQFRSKS